MFNQHGEFQQRIEEIIRLADANYKTLEEGHIPDDMQLQMQNIRKDAQTLLHTIKRMSESLGQIESIEESLKKELLEQVSDVTELDNTDD